MSDKKYRKVIHVLMLMISLYTCCMFAQALFQNESVYRVYSKEGLEHVKFESTEYLYRGTNIENIKEQNVLINQQPCIVSFAKKGCTMNVSVQNSTNRDVECLLPVFYYSCYTAYDVDTGEIFGVERADSENNVMRIVVPPQYTGDIRIEIQENTLWKLSDTISVLAWIGLMLFMLPVVRKRNTDSETVESVLQVG